MQCDKCQNEIKMPQGLGYLGPINGSDDCDPGIKYIAYCVACLSNINEIPERYRA